MTQNQRELFSTRSSTRQFLLSKTEAKVSDDQTGKKSTIDLNALSKAFPDSLSGNAFIDHAMTTLDSASKFGVMVIRIDEHKGSDDDHELDIQINMAKSIDSFCQSENGIWGKLDFDMFGCFFHETNGICCLEFAEKINKNIAEFCNETISIGTASYPVIDFTKDRILDNAIKALDHAAFFGPGSIVAFDSVSLNISGDHLYQEGDINSAIEEYKTALLLDPSNINVLNSLGVCYGVLGAYEKASEYFKAAIRLNPKEVMALFNAGLVKLFINVPDKALEYFLAADANGEDVYEVAFQTGKLYLEKGEYEKGKHFLEKAVKLGPKSATAFRLFGECCAALNLTDEAVTSYKKAIKLNPNDADSLSALGYLFDFQGENPEITTIFCQQSVDISPENGLFRHRLGQLYFKQNQLEDALKEFQKANDLGHDSAEFIEKVQELILDA